MGNVGQLTVDLLVSSLPTERVGYLYDDSVLPVIGNDPFTTANTEHACHLMTAIEGRKPHQYHVHLFLNLTLHKRNLNGQFCASQAELDL